MCKKINITIDELKGLDMNNFICTSVKVMKYLTEICKIRYVALGISKDNMTFWKFDECAELKKALKGYRTYKLI
jgi:hypothetical protein